jgi:ubiquinone biosynthesis protein
MEDIEGIKPSDCRTLTEHGLNCQIVARRGADSVLHQMFERGFFHTDPHARNFFLLSGNVLGLFRLQSMGVLGYLLATILGIWLIVSIIRSGKL